MNIGLELQTKDGKTFIVDVINKKYKNEGRDEWCAYADLKGGRVGDTLEIVWPDNTSIKTAEIVKVDYPKLGD